MGSKALILLGLFTVLFVLSEVAATSENQSGTVKLESEETVQPAQGSYGHGGGGGSYGGGGGYCRHGCCYRGYRGCSRCCSYAGEAVQTQPGH